MKNKGLIFLLTFFVFAILLGCAERVAEQHYKRGEILWRNGNSPMAMRELKAVLRYEPPADLKDKTLVLIGTIAAGPLKDSKTALWAHKERLKIAQTDEQRFDAQKKIAEILVHDFRDYQQAIMVYQRLLSSVPNHEEEPEIRFEIARSFLRLGNYQQSEVELEELCSLFPDSKVVPQARYQLGNIAYLKGKFQNARKIFRDITKAFPESNTSLYATFGIGNCFEEEDNLKKALEIYRTIRTTYPNKTLIEQKIATLEKRYLERGR
ncbi:tol-pal system YbgF family protein [Bdellovibrionota bacterium]